jgi:hypothetical protein
MCSCRSSADSARAAIGTWASASSIAIRVSASAVIAATSLACISRACRFASTRPARPIQATAPALRSAMAIAEMIFVAIERSANHPTIGVRAGVRPARVTGELIGCPYYVGAAWS